MNPKAIICDSCGVILPVENPARNMVCECGYSYSFRAGHWHDVIGIVKPERLLVPMDTDTDIDVDANTGLYMITETETVDDKTKTVSYSAPTVEECVRLRQLKQHSDLPVTKV